jgi:hypothetical protein
MNRSFRRRLDTTPGEHRRHFDQTPSTTVRATLALDA